MATIEYVSGNEQHSSSWGKFYIKGLEKLVVKEEHDENRRDRHHGYQNYLGNSVPGGAVFTVFAQSGDKRGTNDWHYWICVADDAVESTRIAGYGWIEGNFRILAHAEGKVKAPRLMGWWDKRPSNVSPLAYAEHCAAYIDKRGVAELPPIG